MVKTRSGDVSQDFNEEMPVKESSVNGIEDGESQSSREESEKDDSYSPQSWGRELRNRFVLSSNERSRSCAENLRSRYSEAAVGSRRRHTRRCRVAVSMDERGRVYAEDEMMDDSDDIAMFNGDDDDDDDIFTPCGAPRRRRSSRRSSATYSLKRRVTRSHSLRGMDMENAINGCDSNIGLKGDDTQEAEGVRRSTRQRKLLYDNFNTSWILGTQTLRGYPMFHSDKEAGDAEEKEGEGETPEGEVVPGKEPQKRRRNLAGLDPSAVEDDYADMYSRVKRARRQTILYTTKKSKGRRRKLSDSEDEPTESESSEVDGDSGEPVVRREKYHLRKKKPVVERFQISVEPPRRHHSILSLRRRRHRPASPDSSNDECYDRKNKPRNRCMPLNCGQRDLADTDPMELDTSITFSDVGGLEQHIRCLKEMVVFPMLYREVFERFHVTPPKGVLFHGPPGTGKTLIARALANECSQGHRKVAFFMRKGADCLSKWVGESERQLRLLFEQAYNMRPSIIFFDEIDGLAPVRSSRQDQIHASIVSTLLALMDGLTSRGDIIVIGATNRIDAIDPALRRPGRFDRELHFPLPARRERQEILRVHVSRWAQPPEPTLLAQLADEAAGYCGSDLRALCSEAVIQGLQRRYPQIYASSQKLLLDPGQVRVDREDFLRARRHLVPASHRAAPSQGKRLGPLVEPLLRRSLGAAVSILAELFPHGSSNPETPAGPVYRPRLLLAGDALQGLTSDLGPAVLDRLEQAVVHVVDAPALFGMSGRAPEEVCLQVFQEAQRHMPSIIYLPEVDRWWPLVPETVHAVFLSLLERVDCTSPVLLLATAHCKHSALPVEVKALFSDARNEVLSVEDPTEEERRSFFRPLLLEETIKPPQMTEETARLLEELPLAPPPEPPPMSERELQARYEREERTLRELRIFLREICAKLARNRQFFMFTKPVDVNEVPDYLHIVKQPMDLETMMTKIDLHRYACAQDFLDDVDLLCRNALEYNPDRDPADKLIRHRACSLRDTAYTLIKAEMDSDFEEQCREISKSRQQRAESPSRFAPDYMRAHQYSVKGRAGSSSDDTTSSQNKECSDGKPSKDKPPLLNGSDPGIKTSPGSTESASRTKRRRFTFWSRGIDKKRKYQRVIAFPSSVDQTRVNEEEGDAVPFLNGLHPEEPEEASEGSSSSQGAEQGEVEVDRTALEKILQSVVTASKGLPVHSLVQLYMRLAKVVDRHATSWNRSILPLELETALATPVL